MSPSPVFPATGPSRDRPGYDVAAQAESGLMSVTGEADGEPQRVGATLIDAASVQVAAQAILAALFRRERLGVGETIRVSLLEVALNLQLSNWADYFADGVEPRRNGNGQPTCAPAADVFRTRDGMVVVSAYVQSHWLRLCAAIDAPELTQDPRLATNEQRVANRAAMKDAVGARIARLTTSACLELLQRAGIVVAVVRGYAEAAASDDFKASSMVLRAEPNGEVSGYPSFGLPYELCDTGRRRTLSAPAHGVHAVQVLREAGFSESEVDALIEDGVVKRPDMAVRA